MLAAACSAMFVNQAFAQGQEHNDQEKHCGSHIMLNNLYQQYPGLQQEAEYKQQRSWEEGKQNLESNRDFTPPTYIIPVVFHIIHDYGVENISDAQILDQMMILNRDYRKNNADTSLIYTSFQSIAADTKIEFRLAQIDPDGNCTNGIDRIASMETYVGDDGSKLNQWPRDKYLNVWVVKQMMNGVAGYAYYPGAVDGFLYPFDGIIILQDYIGSIGTSNAFTSRALTHEIGHYLSLSHPWGSTNSPGVACGDDGILDTPETKGWSTCPLPQNAKICDTAVVENYQNYMDYSYCSYMFTEGQKDAMHYALNSSTAGRNNLWDSTNLIATGALNTQPVCMPHADFKTNRKMVCEGGSITLTDLTWSSSATSWNWTLTSGATTLTSTLQNPSFTNLTTTGWYDVMLIASNATGSDTMIKNDFILVSPDAAVFNEFYSEGFENQNVFYYGYVSNNRYGNSSLWHQSYWASHTGQGSALLNNYGNTIHGDIDELITPSYYLDNLANIQLQFSYAYATAALDAESNTQALKVYSSTDCGQTWTVRWTRTGQTLCTGGYDANFYIPSNASHWETVTITLPSSVAQPNVRFKFEFSAPEDGTGNNLYIDDINILGSNVGVQENTSDDAFSVYPNPGDGNSTIAYTLAEQSTVKADLYDVSGRLVRTIYSGDQAAGSYTMPVSDETNPLAPGTYMIQMTIGDKVTTQKYIVTAQE